MKKRFDTVEEWLEWQQTIHPLNIDFKLDLDVAILEVGLGGRLDATNIIDSDISIITSIGIDHTEFLGNTIDSIALEKAGVMRPFKKSIFAQEKPPSVLYKYAKNKSVNLFIHNNDYNVLRQRSHWSISSKNLSITKIPNLRMIGDYQYNYAAASVIALQELLPESLSDENILKKSLSETQISGRFQYLQSSPDIVLDVAHNEDAAKALLTNIKDKGYREINVVLGILNDKDVYSIVEPFASVVNNWFIGTINSERGMNSDEIQYRMKSLFKNNLNIKTYNSITTAFNFAKNQQSSNSLLLIYGSFYTVSEVLKIEKSKCNEKNAV